MHHSFDIQIFKGYQAKSVNQITADLMSKFISLVSDPLMNPLDNFESLLSFMSSFRSFR
ncbi:MAG: hypothetical protein A4E48_02237 [Methanosaeta sp. PtaU1.Bin060]|nr:MAG: hypothetical protein A4E48_02237 [Methanosaeta sp. PtaU1.Bin060]